MFDTNTCIYLMKKQHPLDLLIAAHALSLGTRLVTNNLREFRRIPDLRVENWV